MSRQPGWDGELDDLFGEDPDLERTARVLKAGELRQPPLDPRFKHDLRRKLMEAAYDTLPDRPPIWRRLFVGPGLAGMAAAVGIALIAFFVVPTLFQQPQNQVVQPEFVTTRPVALNQPITLKFNQPMDHSSVEKSIQIQPATQVTYQWKDDKTLVIVPAGNQLAGNTQYHVTVQAGAQTSAGKPIPKQPAITFVTAPQPTPPPQGSPSPSPSPAQAITGELQLTPAARSAQWSPDASHVYYLTDGGDAYSVAADGSDPTRILAGGVTSFAVSPDGKSYAAVQNNAPVVGTIGTPAPSASPSPGPPGKAPVDSAGWQGSTPLFWQGAPPLTFYRADGTKLATFKDASNPVLSPDGTRALAGTPGAAHTLVLLDLAAGTSKTWPVPVNAFTWSPDSSKVAYVTEAGVFIAQPDGTGARQVLSVPGGLNGIGWSRQDELLASGTSGSWIAKADGSATQQLRSGAVGVPVPNAFSPDGSALLVLRDTTLTVVHIGANAAISLDAGASVVADFETARIAGDSDKAAGFLTASAARTAAPAPAADGLKLKRYYTVSSALVTGTTSYLRFVVRLVYANGAGLETRYQDETLVLVAQPGSDRPVIDSVSEGAPHDLQGPIVTAVTFSPKTILVYFNSDLKADTVAGAVTLATPDGRRVKADATYADRVVTLRGEFAQQAKLELTVSALLQDVAGGSPEADYTLEVVNPSQS